MAPRKPTAPKTKAEPEREKMAIYLPPDLAQELRIAAVTQRKTISALAEECIRKGLAGDKNAKHG
jgi:hypothetical protein